MKREKNITKMEKMKATLGCKTQVGTFEKACQVEILMI